MSTAKNRARPTVASAVRSLRVYYAIGLASIVEHPPRKMPYGMVPYLARRIGLSPESLNKARRIAELYSVKEVDDICRLSEMHQYGIGVTHVVRVLALPAKTRASLLRRAAEEKWGRLRLDDEVRRLRPNAPVRGRKPAVATDVGGLIVQLRNYCGIWRRFQEAMAASPSVPVDELPPGVRKLVMDATAMLWELERKASRELEKAR